MILWKKPNHDSYIKSKQPILDLTTPHLIETILMKAQNKYVSIVK